MKAPLALCLWVGLAAAAPPTGEHARALLGRSPAEAIGEYQDWDATFRGGIGNSDDTTSGGLAWAEARFLQNYLSCYEAVGDPYWLDKFVDHFDRMLATQQDRNGDGFLAWDTTRYSVGIVEVAEAQNARGLKLLPKLQREDVTRRGQNVTGHRYAIIFPTADSLRVVDLDANEVVLDDTPYDKALVLDLFAGRAWRTAREAAEATTPLTLTGPGREGARFILKTVAPEWIEFVVHDGMVSYPLARFVEAVYRDSALLAVYKPAADRYAAWFANHVHRKWERYWKQVDAGCGAYTYTTAVTEKNPGFLLPHNHYLSLAAAYAVLQDVAALPDRAAYRDKALAMARYFRRNLRPQLDGRAYLWNNWDPAPPQAVRTEIEDYGHASIDLMFVTEAVPRGLEFTVEDAVKFARTYTDVMGNGDPAQPQMSFRVDGKGAKTRSYWHGWAGLGRFDEPAFRQAVKMADGATAAWPQLTEVTAAVGGVSAADHAACRAHTAGLRALLAKAADGNLGFELGLGDRPLAWSYGVAGSEAGSGRVEWSTEAVEGARSLALIAESGTPLVVAELPLDGFTGATRVTVAVRYKTAGEARPNLTFRAVLPGGLRRQEESDPLPLSAAWREATWAFTTRPPVKSGSLLLRNSGGGTVWYDDLRLTRQPAG